MNTSTKKGKGLGEYMPLAFAAGIGSMLGSGIIVGLSATIVVWQEGLGLDTTQVGLLSGILTFAIAFGSLFGGRLADKIGRVLFFNWINLFYAIGAAICVFAPNFTVLLIGLIIAGLASGADLPVSMTIVSHDAPDEATAAQPTPGKKRQAPHSARPFFARRCHRIRTQAHSGGARCHPNDT